MRLEECLSKLGAKLTPAQANILVLDIKLNSLAIKSGDIFVALAGKDSHGLDYLEQAISQGVAAILVDAIDNHPNRTHPKVIAIQDLWQNLASLADTIYPKARTKTLVAITGTNGKSSVASLMVQLAFFMGKDFASIGTLGVQKMTKNGMVNIGDTNLTTPDLFSLYAILDKLKQQTIIIEASSHALAQNRLDGLPIHIAIFTNLSQDHLDYHHNMEAYFASKQRLFMQPELKHAVINQADNRAEILKECLVKNTQFHYFNADTQPKKIPTKLLGDFNQANILAAISGLTTLGMGKDKLISLVPKLNPPEGRLQQISPHNIWVDFAHTPDALTQALKAIKAHKPSKKIVLVFGCGGNKDKSKRPKMGAVASQYASRIILTNDNPRFESPKDIIEQIKAGISQSSVVVIEGRKEAITYAISSLTDNEVLLVAGKGCENFQQIKNNKIPFNDVKECSNLVL